MLSKPAMRNTLFYGDNLPILQDYIPDESIDLIYLDPPFNSNRSYMEHSSKLPKSKGKRVGKQN